MEKLEPKLVIFDMDGLMFDTEKIGGICFRKAAKELGYHVSEELSLSLIGGNGKRNHQILVDALGEDCPLDEISALSRKYRYQDFEENGLGIKPGLVELLAYLKEHQIKTAVASSSRREVIDYYLQLSKLEHRFDYIISGDKVEKSKPEPDIFLNACDHFGYKPEECLVLEDSRNGVLAAYNGNIPVICVPDLLFHDRDIFNLTFATVPTLQSVITLLKGIEIKTVIFDMDGLMFDTENLCIEPLIQAHQNHGYDMTKEDCFKIIGTSGIITKKIMHERFGEDYPFEIVMQEAMDLRLDLIRTKGLPIKSGLTDLLNYLQEQGIDCVVASSSSEKTIKEYLELSNTAKYFKYIVGGNQVKHSKPEPDVFLKALEIAGVNNDEALIFEDSRNGILAASKANISVICVPDLLIHDQEVLNQSFAFIPSLDYAIKFIKKG